MSSSTADRSEVDAAIWCAIAGICAGIPPVNSYVYYFPQGHLENCPSDCNIQSCDGDVDLRRRPVIPCKVISVRYFTSTTSFDQLFAVIGLQPVNVGDFINSSGDGGVRNREDDDDIASVVKILTSTDVIGTIFSVPKKCVDTIFPSIGLNAEINLSMKDTLSKSWTFCYYFTPSGNRHIFKTSKWLDFVEAKGLDVGDSVVFMKKKSTSDLFIGIRKAEKETGGSASSRRNDDGGRIDDVLAAVRAAPAAFEVVYYPRFDHVSHPNNFVVRAEKVHAAMEIPWGAGMRVKMAIETTYRLSFVEWYEGTIEAVLWPGRLQLSPWRMLQVNWDKKPQAMANRKTVSPWQVQLVESSSTNPALDMTSIRSPKRFKPIGHDVPAETESENRIHNFMQAFTELLKKTTPVMLSGNDISDHDPVGKGKGKAEGETQTTPSMILFGQKIEVGKGKGKAHEERNVDDHNNPPQP